MGKPEHPGRVVGVSSHVGVTKYFGKAPKKSAKADKANQKDVQVLAQITLKLLMGGKPTEEEVKLVAAMAAGSDGGENEDSRPEDEMTGPVNKKARVDEVDPSRVEEMVRKGKETASSVDVGALLREKEDNEVVYRRSERMLAKLGDRVVRLHCRLSSPNCDSKTIVAKAAIEVSGKQQVLHCSPLLEGFSKVSILEVIPGHENDKLPVPVPSGFLETLSDARNTFIQWPNDHIWVREVSEEEEDLRTPKQSQNNPKIPEIQKSQGNPKSPEIQNSQTNPKSPEIQNSQSNPKSPEIQKSQNNPKSPEMKQYKRTPKKSKSRATTSSQKSTPETDPEYYNKNVYKGKLNSTTLLSLDKLARALKKSGDVVVVPIDEHVLSFEQTVWVSHDLIFRWCDVDELDGDHVSVWMK